MNFTVVLLTFFVQVILTLHSQIPLTTYKDLEQLMNGTGPSPTSQQTLTWQAILSRKLTTVSQYCLSIGLLTSAGGLDTYKTTTINDVKTLPYTVAFTRKDISHSSSCKKTFVGINIL